VAGVGDAFVGLVGRFIILKGNESKGQLRGSIETNDGAGVGLVHVAWRREVNAAVLQWESDIVHVPNTGRNAE
jgi:hypothetical protein